MTNGVQDDACNSKGGGGVVGGGGFTEHWCLSFIIGYKMTGSWTNVKSQAVVQLE